MAPTTAWMVASGASLTWMVAAWVGLERGRLPPGILALAALAGAAACPLVVLCATIMRFVPLIGQAAYPQGATPWSVGFLFFAGVGLLEEVALWLLASYLVAALRLRLSPARATCFALSAAAGFAAVENARYLQALPDLASGGPSLAELATGRLIVTVAAHLVCAALWGSTMSLSQPRSQQGLRGAAGGVGGRQVTAALLVASLLHAAYDLLQLEGCPGLAAALVGLVGTGTLVRLCEVPRTSQDPKE